MIPLENRQSYLKIWILLVFFFLTHTLYGQNINYSGNGTITKEISTRQDSAAELRKRNVLLAEPDSNFTYEKYESFLTRIADTSRYIVLPINEFRNTLNSNKIVIGLRHDVDIDLNLAFQFSETEFKLGFRSTYFILHTAPYYLENSGNMSLHSEKIIPILKMMQNERHFEIGWHNDLVTLQAVYNIDPVSFLHKELAWLRSNGINIYGSASHGSSFCYTYKYLNYYFFEECTYPVVGQFVNNLTLPIGDKKVPMIKGKFSDFNLEYEAYFINNNKYFSDATITNGIRWNIGMIDLNSLHAGDRVIILLHPVHWHKAYVNADIESFRIKGQISSSIDTINCTVSVEMPYGTNRNSLLAEFAVSPGAYAKISNKLQVNGSTLNDFNDPVVYNVFAENRQIHKEWIVRVSNAKNSKSNFESFEIPGLTRSVNIINFQKTILVEVNKGTDLRHLPVKFELSPGARVWIGNVEQFGKTDSVNFTYKVQYKVLAEDRVSSSTWIVTVRQETIPVEEIELSQKGFSIYPNPSDGIIHLHLQDIATLPTKIDIYKTNGEKVYSDIINKTGMFTIEANLTKLSAGVYIVKSSQSEKPVMIVIQK